MTRIDLADATLDWLEAQEHMFTSTKQEARANEDMLRRVFLADALGVYYGQLAMSDSSVTFTSGYLESDEVRRFVEAEIIIGDKTLTLASMSGDRQYDFGSDEPSPVIEVDFR